MTGPVLFIYIGKRPVVVRDDVEAIGVGGVVGGDEHGVTPIGVQSQCAGHDLGCLDEAVVDCQFELQPVGGLPGQIVVEIVFAGFGEERELINVGHVATRCTYGDSAGVVLGVSQ